MAGDAEGRAAAPGGPLWEGGQARQAEATPGRSSGALDPRSVGRTHRPGRMGTALCGPVARAQQLLARSAWGGVRDSAWWSRVGGLGAPGLCRGLSADPLRRRCPRGQRESGKLGGWHRGARAAWTRVPGTVRGQLDNRSSVVRMAWGKGRPRRAWLFRDVPSVEHCSGSCSPTLTPNSRNSFALMQSSPPPLTFQMGR